MLHIVIFDKAASVSFLLESINRFFNLRQYFFNPIGQLIVFQDPVLVLQAEDHIMALPSFICHINCEHRIVYTPALAKIKFTEATTSLDQVCELYIYKFGHKYHYA